jgi:peptidyl-prolyl cis-trans isomerase D
LHPRLKKKNITMAVIGKIRQHSLLLIVVIGVALAAFVLGDFFQGGGRQQVINVATISGEDISIIEFNRRFEENAENMRQQMQDDRLSQDDLFRVRESTWNQILEEVIMGKEYNKLGLVVTTDELFDQVQGPRPHQAIIQNFTNPETGEYDRSMVLNYLQNLSSMPASSRNQWRVFERFIKEDRLSTKYENLVTKAYYTPEALARKAWLERNQRADFEIVAVRFASIEDNLVTVTDSDYKKYYEENKQSFERIAARDIEYVVFDIVPSATDQRNAETYVMSLVEEFSKTENITGFVNANSDTRHNDNWLSRDEVPLMLEEAFFDAEPGVVFGPYFEDGAYHLARLLDVTFRPDSLKASHILISYAGAMRSEQTRTKAAAERIADSLLNVVQRNPAMLTQIAATMSDDGSASQNNGDLGWFIDGQMVAPFNNFVIDNNVGTIGKVETDFGFHIVQVTDKKAPKRKIKMAHITHAVTPSSQTYQDVFAKASKFATETRSREKFDQVVERDGLAKRVAPSLTPMTNNIPGIQNPRQIVRWVFDKSTRANDVSTIFDLDDKYVIAVLTKKWEEGVPPLEDVRSNIEVQVLNAKKGEYIAERMKANLNDLNAIAAEFGVSVETVPDLNFDTRSIPNYGMENKLIGKMFSLQPNEIAGPVVGNSATFVVRMIRSTPSDETPNFDNIRRDQRNLFSNSVRNNAAMRALEKLSKIEDNRLLFY